MCFSGHPLRQGMFLSLKRLNLPHIRVCNSFEYKADNGSFSSPLNFYIIICFRIYSSYCTLVSLVGGKNYYGVGNTLIPIVYIAAQQITSVTVPLILEPAVYWNVNSSWFGIWSEGWFRFLLLTSILNKAN